MTSKNAHSWPPRIACSPAQFPCSMNYPNANDRPFFLVTAPPGCGKSALVRGLAAARPDWETLKAAERREHNSLLREARPGVFFLCRLLQVTRLEKTRALRSVRAVLTASSTRFVASALSDMAHRDVSLVASIKASFQSNNAEGVHRTRSVSEDDLTKTIVRLMSYKLIAKRSGPPVLCEQDSFWHKLIWLNDPKVFSALPRPTAAVVLTSKDVKAVLEKRNARGAAYDRRRLGPLTEEQRMGLLTSEHRLWADFAATCAQLGIPVLHLEAYGDLGDYVDRAATFFTGIIAQPETR